MNCQLGTCAAQHDSEARRRRLHEGLRSVAIEQREATGVGRPLCTTDRCSDIFKDPLQPRTFNLKQRTIEVAG
jgi:hypothetical protein